MLRQVVLDTETTGIEPELGHRIIEIGCVELVNRRPTGNVFHEYIQPEREIDQGAFEVHGISNEFLADKPTFSEVAPRFMDFIRDSQLVIHNAAFDVGFMDAEFRRLNPKGPLTKDLCGEALDSLKLARDKRPGQRNSLDALCKAFGIDNSSRELHGALLDAQLLAEVYLAITREQNSLLASSGGKEAKSQTAQPKRKASQRNGRVIQPNADEAAAFEAMVATLKKSGDDIGWDSHLV